MKIVPIQYAMYKEDDNPLFGNSVTTARVDDEGGGMFVVIEQCSDFNEGMIKLDFDEVEALYDMIYKLKRDHEEIK